MNKLFLSDSDNDDEKVQVQAQPQTQPKAPAKASTKAPAKASTKVPKEKKKGPLYHEDFDYNKKEPQIETKLDILTTLNTFFSNNNIFNDDDKINAKLILQHIIEDISLIKKDLIEIKELINDKDSVILQHVEVIQKLIKTNIKAEAHESSITWKSKDDESTSNPAPQNDFLLVTMLLDDKYKITGKSTFKYKDIIKEIPTTSWDKESKCWTFNVSELESMKRIFEENKVEFVIN